MQRASLIAGAGIFLVGLGALALVRPWGLRFPPRLVIVPALAGDDVQVVADDRQARDVAQFRQARERDTKLAQQQATKLENVFSQMAAGGKPTITLLIKADVHGSSEALKDALEKRKDGYESDVTAFVRSMVQDETIRDDQRWAWERWRNDESKLRKA